MGRHIVVIPSLKPDNRLVSLIADLKEQGFRDIVIVDDGSGESYRHFFDDCASAGCTVLRHEVNRGKGAALKTAASYIREQFGEEADMITADADGQHLPKDIRRVADDMDAHPDALVLGSRDFGKGTPWKSLCGNRITSVFYLLTCGRWVKDTQTGLRGIPASLMELAVTEEGDRYEYEMNFLMDAALTHSFHVTTIETVYFDDNKGSHFHPVRDAARVYARFIRFLVSSLGGFVVDILMFVLFLRILPGTFEFLPITDAPDGSGFITKPGVAEATAMKIIVAAVLARICSGIANFLLNKFYTFRSRERAAGEAVRYFILFVCQMAASAGFTALLSSVLHAPTPSKIIVDVILFFISYRIQRAWVFR
ncbi:MAG: bifunctional glycosyltransferase family 2/GtrA family protein [Lachnospiraceae bacterium]|nr:bifunctional glycosyltransferase family 2/GtrA family protein [Lachnospiraceae bacterium]